MFIYGLYGLFSIIVIIFSVFGGAILPGKGIMFNEWVNDKLYSGDSNTSLSLNTRLQESIELIKGKAQPTISEIKQKSAAKNNNPITSCYMVDELGNPKSGKNEEDQIDGWTQDISSQYNKLIKNYTINNISSLQNPIQKYKDEIDRFGYIINTIDWQGSEWNENVNSPKSPCKKDLVDVNVGDYYRKLNDIKNDSIKGIWKVSIDKSKKAIDSYKTMTDVLGTNLFIVGNMPIEKGLIFINQMLLFINYGPLLIIPLSALLYGINDWTLKGKAPTKWYSFAASVPTLLIPSIGIVLGHYRTRETVIKQLEDK